MKRLTTQILFALTLAAIALGAEELDWSQKYFLHLVKSGENLSQISKDYYGTPVHSDIIQKVNGIANVTQLPVERTLLTPTNNYFLDKAGVKDASSTDRGFYRKETSDGRLYIGIHTPRQDIAHPDSRRFIIIDITGLDYKAVFDSEKLLDAHPDMPDLSNLTGYSFIDLDGDEGLDVLGRDAGTTTVTHYVFHQQTDGVYEPYLIVKNTSVAFENHYRDPNDNSLVFVYEPPEVNGKRLAAKVAAWKNLFYLKHPEAKPETPPMAEQEAQPPVEEKPQTPEASETQVQAELESEASVDQETIAAAKPEKQIAMEDKTPILPEQKQTPAREAEAQPIVEVEIKAPLEMERAAEPEPESAPEPETKPDGVTVLPPGEKPEPKTTALVPLPPKTAEKPAETKSDALVDRGDYALYTVQHGDTLGGIAERQLRSFLNYTLLLTINDMAHPNELRVGQQIIIPQTNTYFLQGAELNLSDGRLEFQKFVNKKKSTAVVGIALPQKPGDDGRRFLVIDPRTKPFQIEFDSQNLKLSPKSDEYQALQHLDEWFLGDSNEDGDMDIVGMGMQNKDGHPAPVQMIFEKRWGRFRAKFKP